MQRNDSVLTALGAGEYNDLLLAYYITGGATTSCLNDAEYQFLVAKGATPAALPDMWTEILLGLGYSGALTDMMKAFWGDGGVFPSGDWILETGSWNDEGTWDDSAIWNDGV